jgi:hypothetical protein
MHSSVSIDGVEASHVETLADDDQHRRGASLTGRLFFP